MTKDEFDAYLKKAGVGKWHSERLRYLMACKEMGLPVDRAALRRAMEKDAETDDLGYLEEGEE